VSATLECHGGYFTPSVSLLLSVSVPCIELTPIPSGSLPLDSPVSPLLCTPTPAFSPDWKSPWSLTPLFLSLSGPLLRDSTTPYSPVGEGRGGKREKGKKGRGEGETGLGRVEKRGEESREDGEGVRECPPRLISHCWGPGGVLSVKPAFLGREDSLQRRPPPCEAPPCLAPPLLLLDGISSLRT
jgi:hypothetical protein